MDKNQNKKQNTVFQGKCSRENTEMLEWSQSNPEDTKSQRKKLRTTVTQPESMFKDIITTEQQVNGSLSRDSPSKDTGPSSNYDNRLETRQGKYLTHNW